LQNLEHVNFIAALIVSCNTTHVAHTCRVLIATSEKCHYQIWPAIH